MLPIQMFFEGPRPLSSCESSVSAVDSETVLFMVMNPWEHKESVEGHVWWWWHGVYRPGLEATSFTLTHILLANTQSFGHT